MTEFKAKPRTTRIATVDCCFDLVGMGLVSTVSGNKQLSTVAILGFQVGLYRVMHCTWSVKAHYVVISLASLSYYKDGIVPGRFPANLLKFPPYDIKFQWPNWTASDVKYSRLPDRLNQRSKEPLSGADTGF